MSTRLCGVTLCGVKLCGVTLCGVTLCGVTLCGVTLCGVTLCGVTLCGVTLCGVTLCGVTFLKGESCSSTAVRTSNPTEDYPLNAKCSSTRYHAPQLHITVTGLNGQFY